MLLWYVAVARVVVQDPDVEAHTSARDLPTHLQLYAAHENRLLSLHLKFRLYDTIPVPPQWMLLRFQL